MLVREIEFGLATENSAAFAHVEIDGKEYLITGWRGAVTVYAGRWIRDRRGVGKTFRSAVELATHYKAHGQELLRYAGRLTDLAA